MYSPGFRLIWPRERSQSSSMTTSRKSQAFPMVCHRVLCWVQFCSFSTENLFLTWFSATLLSLNLFVDDTQFQVPVPPPSIQSAVSSLETCLSDIQTGMLENKLKLNNDKTDVLLIRSFFKSFFSFQAHHHLCLPLWNLFFFFCEKSWFVHHRWHERGTAHKERMPIGLLSTSPYQHNSSSSFRWLWTKRSCLPLSSLG